MVFLISLSDFKNRVIISENIKDDIIKPSIIAAQEMHLNGVICNTLYDLIVLQVQNCDVESRITFLIDKYIKPYLVYTAYVDYLVNHDAKGTRQGIVRILGDNAQSLDSESIYSMLKAAQDKSKYYENKIINFLLNRTEDYPEFEECACKNHNNPYGFQISSIGTTQKESDLFNGEYNDLVHNKKHYK